MLTLSAMQEKLACGAPSTTILLGAAEVTAELPAHTVDSPGTELRLQLRPSGTEPKVKLYGEGMAIDPAPFLEALAALLVPSA